MEDDSKQRLLQAAIQLFAAHGFESVSIRQIAKAAETNSAMISYYFGSKQKLYEAAIDAQAAALHEFLTPKTAELTPQEVFRCYAQTLQKIHVCNPTLLQFICREFAAPSEHFETFIQKRLHQVFLLLADALQRGIEEGIFRPDIEIIPTLVLWAGMVNFYYLSRNLHQRISPEAQACSEASYMEHACKIFFAGIERRPAP